MNFKIPSSKLLLCGVLLTSSVFANVTRTSSLPTVVNLSGSNVDVTYNLDSYYSGATSYYAQVLSGVACLDDDSVNDCIQPFTLTASNVLYAQKSTYGTAQVEISAIGTNTLKDTVTFVLSPSVAPSLYSSVGLINLNYGVFPSTYYYTNFNNAETYSITSKYGIVKAYMDPIYPSEFRIDSVYGKWGIDTLIVKASNSLGDAFDTIPVEVSAPPLPITQVKSIGDITFGAVAVDSMIDLNSYFTNATSYSVNLLSGAACFDDDSYNDCYSSFSMYSNYLYTQMKNNGIAIAEIVATNGAYTLRDTVVYSMNLPIPPTRTSAISDLNFSYNFGNYYYNSTYFANATSYSITSKYGVVAPTMNSSYPSEFDLASVVGKWGVDTLIVTATNSYGSAYDTIQVTVTAPPLPVTKIKTIPDIQLRGSGIDTVLNLPSYFANATTYSIKLLSGTACFDDDNYNDCLQPFTLVESNNLYGQMTSNGLAVAEITASNGSYSLKDTVVYSLNLTTPPTRTSAISDLNFSYNFGNSYYISTYFANATSYSITSKYGVVAPTMNSSYPSEFDLASVAGKWGVDTLIVAATNSYGSAYDTIQVTVAAPPLPVTKIKTIPDIQLRGNGIDTVLNLPSYFANATTYSIKLLSGTACFDDDNYNDCLQPFTLVESNNLYGQMTSNGLAVAEITASNTESSVVDTVVFSLSGVSNGFGLKTPFADTNISLNTVAYYNLGSHVTGQNLKYSATSTDLSKLQLVVMDSSIVMQGFVNGKVNVVITATDYNMNILQDTIIVNIGNTATLASYKMQDWAFTQIGNQLSVDAKANDVIAIYNLKGEVQFRTILQNDRGLLPMNLTSGLYLIRRNQESISKLNWK